MRRHHPDHQMDIPISLKVYHQRMRPVQGLCNVGRKSVAISAMHAPR
jgi:hypothetical protein